MVVVVELLLKLLKGESGGGEEHYQSRVSCTNVLAGHGGCTSLEARVVGKRESVIIEETRDTRREARVVEVGE
ncbi:hypothetical protein R1flu_029120 [Riccia fluitans]|uniref:Uncharacterized protein n=1 Tax=Riccia fluitans TaxID=41844 RepID=A0ABD1XNM0_9MARC